MIWVLEKTSPVSADFKNKDTRASVLITTRYK